MMLQREPGPALRPFVKWLWAVDDSALPATQALKGEANSAGRERVLPTGDMHIAVRLSDSPVCLFDGIQDANGAPPWPRCSGGHRRQVLCAR
jgi:hypothetical protein